MKKHLAYTMASLMALSTMAAPAVSVYAQTGTGTVQTVKETVTIQTAEDFLNQYCSYKKETKDAQGNITKTEYIRFTQIDEKNYQIVLSGQKVYESLSKELQTEINHALMKTVINLNPQVILNKTYPQLVAEAQTVLANLQKPQQDTATPGDSTQTPEIPENSTQTPETPDQNTESGEGEESKVEIEETEEIKEDSQEKPEEDLKEESEEEPKEESTQTTETEIEDQQEAVATPLKQSLKTEKIAEPVLLKTAALAQEPVSVEEKVEMAPIAVPAVQPVQEKIETPAQPVEAAAADRTLSSTDSEVQTFVKTYLMDANSNLYTSVSNYNYQQILSGMSAYSKLSTDQVAQLNSYLETNGSSKYITLVSQAQRIDNGSSSGKTSPIRRSVNTATSSSFGLYGALMTLSCVGFAGLWKKMKEKKA